MSRLIKSWLRCFVGSESDRLESWNTVGGSEWVDLDSRSVSLQENEME